MISSVYQSSPRREVAFKREGDTLLVSDASHKGCRCPGDFFYAVKQQSDSIEITGNDQQRGRIDFLLSLSENGVQVRDTAQRGEGVMNVTSASPLNTQQQGQLGLNVASSLIGIPLMMESVPDDTQGHAP